MVLGIELLNATQAFEFRRPKKSSAMIEKLVTEYRKTVPFIEKDRIIHEDMMKSIEFMNKYQLD
jgi:histidine ammonia-lyase